MLKQKWNSMKTVLVTFPQLEGSHLVSISAPHFQLIPYTSPLPILPISCTFWTPSLLFNFLSHSLPNAVFWRQLKISFGASHFKATRM